MRAKQNGVTVEERLEDQSPYKLWTADVWECVECGVEIIAGFGHAPLAEHWQPEYWSLRESMASVPILVDQLRVALLPRTANECWGRGAAFSLAMEQARRLVVAL
jgi:hypothetical protein